MNRLTRVLNLGGGTQSSVLLLMSHLGELPKLDVAIFADTGWEPASVYRHVDWLRRECTSIPIVTVSNGNIYSDAMHAEFDTATGKFNEHRWASMPYFVKNPDGSRGIVRRQCTNEYKITPINRYIKTEVLGLNRRGRWPTECVVERWFGISFDEMQRMRDPDGAWCRNVYPLVDMKWRRQRAIDWAAEHYPGKEFPRSACVGCPFHSNAEWRRVKGESDAEWEQAVELDRKVRNLGGIRGSLYLHSSLTPLEELDLRSRDEKSGQLNFWDDECHGICGV